MVKQVAKTGCNVLLVQKSILRDAVTDLSLDFCAKAELKVFCISHSFYWLQLGSAKGQTNSVRPKSWSSRILSVMILSSSPKFWVWRPGAELPPFLLRVLQDLSSPAIWQPKQVQAPTHRCLAAACALRNKYHLRLKRAGCGNARHLHTGQAGEGLKITETSAACL